LKFYIKEIVTAHCPNTGSMKGLLDEGNEVFISKNDDPKRKLKYTLEIIKVKKKTAKHHKYFFEVLHYRYCV
jgi:sugar fermentation stimulation protein A